MKNLLKMVGIIAFIAVIGFSMIACGGDDGGDGLPAPVVSDPNMSLPAISTISSSDFGSSYTAINNTTEAEQVIEGFFDFLLGGMGNLPMFSINQNNVVLSRNAIEETINLDLSSVGDIPEGMDLTGWLVATYYESETRMSINGRTKFRAVIDEPMDIEDDDLVILGTMVGEGRANISATETSGSGNVSANIKGVSGVGFDGNKFARISFEFSINQSVNMENAKINVNVKMSVYGDGTSPLVTRDLREEVDLSDFMP